MFIKQKKIQLLIFITLTQCLAFGQNFAYIHRDSVLYNTPNYVNNIKKTDSLTQAYKNEIKVAQESLQQKLNDLLSKYSPKEGETLDILRTRMTAIDTTSLGILTDEDIMIQNKIKSYDNILKFTFERDVKPLLLEVDKIIVEYAIKNNLSIILFMKQLLKIGLI